MQVSQSNSNLCDLEPRLLFGEPFHLVKVSEQLPSLDEFHQEVYSKLILEHIVHANDERVLDCIENVLFQFNVLILLIIDDYIFSDAFHGVNISCVHILY